MVRRRISVSVAFKFEGFVSLDESSSIPLADATQIVKKSSRRPRFPALVGWISTTLLVAAAVSRLIVAWLN